jgi:hypothetical protein
MLSKELLQSPLRRHHDGKQQGCAIHDHARQQHPVDS